jgi:hypothetical protein
MEDRYKICKIAFDLDPIEREDDDETINNLQSDDTQIVQSQTDGTLADLNLSDESNVESSEEDDNLSDADRPSL